jgi:hypothetical protein
MGWAICIAWEKFLFLISIQSLNSNVCALGTVQIGYVAGSKTENLAPALKAFCIYNMVKIKNEEAMLMVIMEKYW